MAAPSVTVNGKRYTFGPGCAPNEYHVMGKGGVHVCTVYRGDPVFDRPALPIREEVRAAVKRALGYARP